MDSLILGLIIAGALLIVAATRKSKFSSQRAKPR